MINQQNSSLQMAIWRVFIMKNHFDLQIKSTTNTKGPTIYLTKWLFNIMIFSLMTTIVVISVVIFIKMQPESNRGEMIRQIPLPDFAVLNRVHTQAQVEQEVKILLAQEEIDPLTHFINKYRNDSDKVSYVQTVTAEREHRCEQIKTLYQNREKTTTTLMRLKKFYQYSCPQVIEHFSTTANSKSFSRL
jgi:multidrug efflux pump subunit AcrB